MKPAERMEKVCEYTHLGAISLANKIGLQRGRIRDIIKNDAKSIPVVVADAISANFPTISREWILTGNGQMLVNENQETQVSEELRTHEPISNNEDLRCIAKILEHCIERLEQLIEKQTQVEELARLELSTAMRLMSKLNIGKEDEEMP